MTGLDVCPGLLVTSRIALSIRASTARGPHGQSPGAARVREQEKAMVVPLDRRSYGGGRTDNDWSSRHERDRTQCAASRDALLSDVRSSGLPSVNQGDMMAATRVDADELIAQFVGVHDEHGGWETQPVASPNLIHEICRQLRPASREALREQLYLLEPDHELTYREQLAVNVGFRRWRRDRRRRRHLGLL